MNLNRRQFLQGSAALSGAALLSGCALMPMRTSESGDTWHMGWKNVNSDALRETAMQVEGKIPKQLNGTMLRNGPALFERAGERYQHWFDGDGMLQKFQLQDGKVTHRGQFIHTEKYLKEQQAQRFLYSGAGSVFPDKTSPRNNDSVNAANTSVIHWNNETLALWEGGSAYAVNADDLSTLGIKTWQDDLQHMPFSAHPKVDKQGYLWNFGSVPYYGKTGGLIIYKLRPGGAPPEYHLLSMPFAGYVHDFAQTENHLVFYIPPYHYSHSHGDTFVSRYKWQPGMGGKLMLVDKNNLSKYQVYDAPAGFVFHFGQAWEQGKDVKLIAAWCKTPQVMAESMYQIMAGQDADYDKAFASVLTLSRITGNVTLERSGYELEFPGFDEHRSAARERVFGIGRRPGSKHHYTNATLSWHSDNGSADQYFFDEGIMAEEPLFIADKSRSQTGAGWLLQTALNYRTAQSQLYVFDALSIASGPVAVASMERTLPLGFHGTFISA